MDTPVGNVEFRAGGLTHFSVLVEAYCRDTGADAYAPVLGDTPAYFENLPGFGTILKQIYEGQSGKVDHRATPTPKIDDQPERLQQYGADEEKAWLMAHRRDAEGARTRFASSGFVERFVPAILRENVALHFENQRVFNDFIFSSATAKKGTRLLHDVLTRAPFEVTPQLILESDPDIQRALREASPEKRVDPRLRVHVAVSHLVERDYESAIEALAEVEDADLPLGGLRTYLEAVVEGVSIREPNRR